MGANRRYVLGILLVIAVAATAIAVCDQTSASQADIDLWNCHGCWQDFFLWQYRAYDLREDDWGNRGWNDACNVNLEFPKHWNAAFLVTYGLLDNNDQSFHGTVDYRATAEAADSTFHDDLYHSPSDATNFFGSYIHHIFGPNEVQTSCLLYSTSLPGNNANPGSRAGDFMHEGWHAWADKYNWTFGSCSGHQATQGNCTLSPCGCDYFYFHGIAAYVFGAMWENDGTANRFHSPTQVQVEFLCDVADQPQPWVPASVRAAAQIDANARSATRFINGPGYFCGNPRPW